MAEATTSGGQPGPAETAAHGAKMDRMYAGIRHIYDATRKYYLLGRDRMIADLATPENGTVLEVGCGTGRNLVAVALAYPKARLYGFDISREMLKSARKAVDKAGLGKRIDLDQGDATDFEAGTMFGVPAFDRVYFSYTLSMVPDWRAAVAQAARHVAPGGSLSIVDFGDCAGLPKTAGSVLNWWLARFHVTPRTSLPYVAAEVATAQGLEAFHQRLYGGYAQLVTLRRPA